MQSLTDGSSEFGFFFFFFFKNPYFTRKVLLILNTYFQKEFWSKRSKNLKIHRFTINSYIDSIKSRGKNDEKIVKCPYSECKGIHRNELKSTLTLFNTFQEDRAEQTKALFPISVQSQWY